MVVASHAGVNQKQMANQLLTSSTYVSYSGGQLPLSCRGQANTFCLGIGCPLRQRSQRRVSHRGASFPLLHVSPHDPMLVTQSNLPYALAANYEENSTRSIMTNLYLGKIRDRLELPWTKAVVLGLVRGHVRRPLEPGIRSTNSKKSSEEAKMNLPTESVSINGR